MLQEKCGNVEEHNPSVNSLEERQYEDGSDEKPINANLNKNKFGEEYNFHMFADNFEEYEDYDLVIEKEDNSHTMRERENIQGRCIVNWKRQCGQILMIQNISI